jgi:hypothetical protein
MPIYIKSLVTGGKIYPRNGSSAKTFFIPDPHQNNPPLRHASSLSQNIDEHEGRLLPNANFEKGTIYE